MKFILTIDTEADNQWEHGCELTVKNIGFIPRFQELCNKYSIKPTYLVTSEVCEDAFAKEIFSGYLAASKAEVGAHLHSWTTPPYLDQSGYRFNDEIHAFASEIDVNVLQSKITNLTHQIETSFGKRPTSFRSGRYGFNKDVARILSENNFKVDSSVTPYTRWSANKGLPTGIGGPDFTDKTPFPFLYHFGNNSLLEIPVTILPTKFPLNKFPVFTKYYFQNVNDIIILKILRKLFFQNQPLWLRPYERMTIQLFSEIILEAKNMFLPYIVMMFHSSELMPGGSKYRIDENAIERLYVQLEAFFILITEWKIDSITLSEATLIL